LGEASYVCLYKVEQGGVSPRDEHFLRNSLFSVLRTFVAYSYTFFSYQILCSYFLSICYFGLPADNNFH